MSLFMDVHTMNGPVGVADVACIDSINIFRAAMKAMADALTALGTAPCLALIDGNHAPPIACKAARNAASGPF